MSCSNPLEAYWSKFVNAKGRRVPVFNRDDSNQQAFDLPCGRCASCRLDRSRQWAVRIMHQTRYHERNAFITLTYDDENCPNDHSLNLAHFQRFMKRYRKAIAPTRIKYFHAGEYGEQFGRPHYHAIIFGHDFDDQIPFKKSKDGWIYTSEKLAKLWGKGHCSTANVTFETAQYVAKYCLKKITGEEAAEHYYKVDQTGEVHHVIPEYSSCSNGIGKQFWEQYRTDMYNHDECIIIRNGNPVTVPIPPYYDKLEEKHFPDSWERIRKKRAEKTQRLKSTERNARQVIERNRVQKTQRKLN